MKIRTFATRILPLVTLIALLLSGCGAGSSSRNSHSVSEMAELIKSSISFDYYPDMAVDADTLESLFGLSPDMYEDYFCEMPMISVQSDMLMIVQPKQGQEQAVLDALNQYLDYEQNEALQYPTNAVQVKASEVYEKDGYIYYIALFGDTTGAESDDSQLLALCKEHTNEVKRIIDEAD